MSGFLLTLAVVAVFVWLLITFARAYGSPEDDERRRMFQREMEGVAMCGRASVIAQAFGRGRESWQRSYSDSVIAIEVDGNSVRVAASGKDVLSGSLMYGYETASLYLSGEWETHVTRLAETAQQKLARDEEARRVDARESKKRNLGLS